MDGTWKAYERKIKRIAFLSTHSSSAMTVFQLPKTFCNEINSDAKILVGYVRTWPKRKRKKNSLDIQTVKSISLLFHYHKRICIQLYIYIYTIHNYTYENVTIRLEHRSNQPLKRLYTKLSNHTLWIVAILKLNSLTKTVFNNLKAFESIVGTLIIGVC